jgi:hypothetical protein
MSKQDRILESAVLDKIGDPAGVGPEARRERFQRGRAVSGKVRVEDSKIWIKGAG